MKILAYISALLCIHFYQLNNAVSDFEHKSYYEEVLPKANMQSAQRLMGAEFSEVGKLSIISSYHNIYCVLNFTDLFSLFDTFDKMKRPLKKVNFFKNATILLHLEKSVQHHKRLIKDYLELTKNKFSDRQKRGLVDGVGVGMKYLFGTATTEDVAEVKRKFHSFAQTQKKIIKTLNKDSSLLHDILPTVGKITYLS